MDLTTGGQNVSLRPPDSSDGGALQQLIRACPPLDANSLYCNLLQCTHFAGTSVVAESGSDLLGAITGYLVPGREDTLFIWQVAVAESARGQALGRRMLNHILARPRCAPVSHLETTVTGSNAASWALFEGFARRLGCELRRSPLFDRSIHFGGQHETEILARIGPLPDFQRIPEQAFTRHLQEKLT
jgi:L-2,4-diaminobutyric acid acetyltransferase